MRSRSPGQRTTRLLLGGAAAGLLWLASAGAAGAAVAPDPLGDALTSVTDPTTAAVTQLLAGGSGLPSPPPAPSLPAPPALPALPGQGTGEEAQDEPGATAEVRAPAGDDLAAVDAAVADFLGVCARVPRSVVPVHADIVVLDRNVIAELVDAGVPLEPLVVPCPKAAAAIPATPSGPAAPAGAGPRPGGSADPASAVPTALAFTGTETGPTLLLAGGLLALGTAFLRKAHQLAVVR